MKLDTSPEALPRYVEMAKECKSVRELCGIRYMNCNIGSLYNLFKKYPEFKEIIHQKLEENKIEIEDEIYNPEVNEINKPLLKKTEIKGKDARRKANKTLRGMLTKDEAITIIVPKAKKKYATGSLGFTLEEKMAYTKAIADLYLHTTKGISDCCREVGITPKMFHSWRTAESPTFTPEVLNLWNYEVKYAKFIQEEAIKKQSYDTLLKSLSDRAIKERRKKGTVNPDGSITATDVTEIEKILPANPTIALQIMSRLSKDWNMTYEEGLDDSQDSSQYNTRYLTDDELEEQLTKLKKQAEFLETDLNEDENE